ncbi:MAG: hypothetical protein JSW58_05295 [Candidatus Latescibacterota bacterium]|nr:MAG: hypothetical protein JSW58_05295 [Candidatus Latescibacterota bacterium]
MKKLLLVLTSTLLSLVIVEVIARLLLSQPGVRPFDPNRLRGLLTFHPTRHYAYTPGFVGTTDTEEYHTDVRINALGLRDDEVDPDSSVDVLAAGDSFTVGHGVQAYEAWPSQLESSLNSTSVLGRKIRVLNTAVSGYSLTQIALLIDELLYLEPRLVVLGLYAAADLRRHDPYVFYGGHMVLRSMKPHLRLQEDAFLYSPYDNDSIRRLHFWFMENFHVAAYVLDAIHRLTGESSDWTDQRFQAEKKKISLLDELGRLNERLKAREIGLVVLLVNHQAKDGTFNPLQKRYNSAVTNYCRKEGITIFDPLPSLELRSRGSPLFRIGEDHHWSRHAHALVGTQVAEFLLQQQWIVDVLRAHE